MTDLECRLEAMLDREDIREVLRRLSMGTDRGDIEMIKSGFHPDATLRYHPGFSGNAWDLYETRLRAPSYGDTVGVGDPNQNELLGTQHHLTNIRVELDGDTARTETYLLGVHCTRNGDSVYTSMVGVRYIDVLERRSGQWKVASRLAVHDWNRVDPVEQQMPTVLLYEAGRRDRADASYWAAP